MAIRVIHVGVGGRGVWPISAFQKRDDLESVALVDIREEALTAARETTGLGEDRCFFTMEKALETVEADAVCVITPPHLHAAQCLAAVRAGKHVLVEKPFTMDLAEAQEIMDVADTKEVRVCAAQNVRHLAGCMTLSRLVREGTYGSVTGGIMTKFGWRPGVHHSGNVLHSYLWERGVHDLDTLRALFNCEAVRVYGHSYNPPWSPYQHGSGTHAMIEFENGAICTYLCTFVSHASGSDVRIECTEGSLRDAGDHIEVSRAGKPEVGQIPLDDVAPPETQLLDGFRKYIETGDEPSFGGHENLKTLALIEAVAASSDGKRIVEL
ncbi:MAG: hypothetical protein AUJ92_11130 [Armatimonadetes bacterium CG2_30_59_28]|nr:Gfo/Idh/MocA family oxidoreductase [Armatimonadota bacterium]OIO94006.1 MAG: hypothetical protein AUJ92_11130 [Armatimonadetes bacterium CG2_30_59_28]PIU62400.1 MAG: hypothetical protein COS85_18555 [Armatimonadetes bacterium CG07_land_8_20_14_0_80_59_28]